MAPCTSNTAAGYVDLATYDDLETYLYDWSSEAKTLFVRSTAKSTWFTGIPVVLNKAGGNQVDFGSTFTVNITRSADYAGYLSLYVKLPAVKAKNVGDSVRWVEFVGHNLIEEACLTFNDLTTQTLTSEWLDMWAGFTVGDGNHHTGYNTSVGQIPSLYSGATAPAEIPGRELCINLPFHNTLHISDALPMSALTYNEVQVKITLRSLEKLLIVSPSAGVDPSAYTGGTAANLASVPRPEDVRVICQYYVLGNDERAAMACSPRTMLINQIQYANPMDITEVKNNYTLDMRFSHAVRALFFGWKNITAGSMSNYSTSTPYVDTTSDMLTYGTSTADPVSTVSMSYDNVERFRDFPAIYFATQIPLHHASTTPRRDGLHLYSYARHIEDLIPSGSTNYGKLSTAYLTTAPSDTAKHGLNFGTSYNSGADATGISIRQKYQFVLMALSYNVLKISGGTIGLPIL